MHCQILRTECEGDGRQRKEREAANGAKERARGRQDLLRQRHVKLTQLCIVPIVCSCARFCGVFARKFGQ